MRVVLGLLRFESLASRNPRPHRGMDPRHLRVTRIPHAMAAILGLILANRARRFRPIAHAVAILFAIDAARSIARGARPDAHDRIAAYLAGHPLPPYEGLARASWAAEQALTVAWYAVLALGVWEALRVPQKKRGDDDGGVGYTRDTIVMGDGDHASQAESGDRNLKRSFVDHPRTVAAGAIAVFLAAELFALYPAIRGRPVEVAHVLVFVASLAAQCSSATIYAMAWTRPAPSQIVALVLTIGSVADLAGPMMLGHPVRDAAIAGPAGMLIWLAIGGVEAWAIAVIRSGRSSRFGSR